MVGMPVGDKYGINSETAPSPHHLLLGTFTAVE
jgi:hypothetical protein